VANEIESADPELTALHVLNWVMHNTIHATADGLPEWASQGSHFCTTQKPEARLIDENLTLEGLYSGAIVECTVYDHVRLSQAKDVKRVEARGLEPDETAKRTLEALSEDRAKLYGSDLPIVSTGLDEECERELENERELEREAERQYPRCKPQTPALWPVSAMLCANSPEDVASPATVVSLSAAMRRCFGNELSAIAWDESGLFVTENYIQTVLSQLGTKLDDLGDYMRPVEWIAVFPSQECLLLSEWEAEQALGMMWKSENDVRSTSSVQHYFQTRLSGYAELHLVNLFDLREAADAHWTSPPRLALPAVSPRIELISQTTMAALQILAGETMFGQRDSSVARDRAKALGLLLPTKEAKKAALVIPSLRGLQHNIARSDLESFCNVDIGEA